MMNARRAIGSSTKSYFIITNAIKFSELLAEVIYIYKKLFVYNPINFNQSVI